GILVAERVLVHAGDKEVEVPRRGLGAVDAGNRGADPVAQDARVELSRGGDRRGRLGEDSGAEANATDSEATKEHRRGQRGGEGRRTERFHHLLPQGPTRPRGQRGLVEFAADRRLDSSGRLNVATTRARFVPAYPGTIDSRTQRMSARRGRGKSGCALRRL